MGPGAYDADRADSITRTKIQNINMGTSASRGTIVQKTTSEIGPGQYEDRKQFGS